MAVAVVAAMRVHRRNLGGPNIINPSSIAGWIAIHDSRSITPQSDSSALASWPDTSGNGRDAAPVLGFSPLYRTGGGAAGTPTGAPIVEFHGNRAMLYGLPSVGGIDTTGGWTAMLWFQQGTLGHDQKLYWSPIANNYVLYSVSTDAEEAELTVDGATATAGVAMTTGYHILEAIGHPPHGLAAGGIVEVWQDGALAGQSDGTGWDMDANSEQHLSEVAVQTNQRIAWAGYINVVLTAPQREGIRNWLIQEFGPVG